MNMIHLITSTSEQTISILPREYTTSVVVMLRDDSTNDEVSIMFPSIEVSGNYLNITNIFTLKEGHFYDITAYKVGGDYGAFRERVVADSGTFEDNTCLYNYYDSLELINLSDLDVIYKDKIFCTSQSVDQNTNTFYSPNVGEFTEQSANNDFIIYE